MHHNLLYNHRYFQHLQFVMRNNGTYTETDAFYNKIIDINIMYGLYCYCYMVQALNNVTKINSAQLLLLLN